MKEKRTTGSKLLTVFFSLLSVVWLVPIFAVLLNSFKENGAVNTNPFALPNSETFMGMGNYVKGMTFVNYPFLNSVFYSVLITVLSTILILVCTSMAAWYIVRVNDGFSKFMYLLCAFSMIAPFQMVMFTLSSTADKLKLNTPWTIPIHVQYLKGSYGTVDLGATMAVIIISIIPVIIVYLFCQKYIIKGVAAGAVKG